MKKILIWLVLAILVAVVLSPLLRADGCNLRPREIYNSYKQNLYYYSNGYYVEYRGGDYGQLYTYDGGYYRPYHQYKERVILVPKAIEVEVHRDHYYSIDSYAQQNLLADAIVGRLMRQMQNEGRVGSAGAASTGVTTRLKPTDSGPSGPPASTPTGELVAGAYQSAELLKVLNDSCVKCHGTSSKQTRLVTADGKIADVPAGKVWECFALVNSGEMPKGLKQLDNEPVKLFYDWGKNARK